MGVYVAMPNDEVQWAAKKCQEIEYQAIVMLDSVEAFVEKFQLDEDFAQELAEQLNVNRPPHKEGKPKQCKTYECLQRQPDWNKPKEDTFQAAECDERCQEQKAIWNKQQEEAKKSAEKKDKDAKLTPQKYNAETCGYVRDVVLNRKPYQIFSCLKAGEMLMPGQGIVAENGALFFVLQKDGNSVVYEDVNGYYSALWSSRTFAKPITHMILQKDGGLFIYNSYSPVWNNDGKKKGLKDDLKLFMRNNGMLETENSKGETIHKFGTRSIFWK